MKHILHIIPQWSSDAVAQARRLVSGSGIPTTHPDGPYTWGVTWNGVPQHGVHKQTWIAIYSGGLVYGCVRYCHTIPRGRGGHIGDPPRRTSRAILVVDKYVRFDPPMPYSPQKKYPHYLTPSEASSLRVPGPNGGDPITWVDGNVQRTGCPVCGFP